MKILTVKKLEELLTTSDVSIKSRTKAFDPYSGGDPYIGKPLKAINIVVERHERYINVSWSNNEGDPNISVNDENQEINFIYDSSDSDYSYTLYID